MNDKLDKISSDISEIKIILAGQAVELKEHIRRTALLEEALQPISVHVARVEGALKAMGVLALIGTLTTGVLTLADFLTHHFGMK